MTPLGLLNFLVLQWFGLRLTRKSVMCSGRGEPPIMITIGGRSMTAWNPPVITRRRWRLKRWVWPLTGWWSPYRWIYRRPFLVVRITDRAHPFRAAPAGQLSAVAVAGMMGLSGLGLALLCAGGAP